MALNTLGSNMVENLKWEKQELCGEVWRQAGSGTVSQSLALTSASTNAADHCWSTTYHLPSLTFMPQKHVVKATC